MMWTFGLILACGGVPKFLYFKCIYGPKRNKSVAPLKSWRKRYAKQLRRHYSDVFYESEVWRFTYSASITHFFLVFAGACPNYIIINKINLLPRGYFDNFLKNMEMDETKIKTKIKEQGDKVRELKNQKADQQTIEVEVAALLKYKKQLEDITGEGGYNKSKGKFVLKTPKGTRDYNEKEMAIREKIFSTITSVFKKHGAVTIDTPVFELKEILSGKYGEDSKLIYDLEDQGGEKCSLRYDLTVPFARFLAMTGTQYQNIKRYQIAKVYRRDQPAMTKGRMREFFQCDFDIAGSYEPMLPDSEVVRIMCECLSALDVGKFTVKINHRKILDGIFEVCGVTSSQIRPISSAVDKLDKLPWEDVRKEMTEEKALDPDIADKIGEYVQLKGGRELLEKLLKDKNLTSNRNANVGLDEMKVLLKYLEIFNVLEKISFDLSLARGLDYYTGIIYEAVTEHSGPPIIHASTENIRKTKNDLEEFDETTVGVGSIAAGGRYDNLVGMFANSKKGNIPCVGMSIGVERIFSILLQKVKLEEVKANEVQVYVMAVGDGLLEDRMKISAELWNAGIKAEFMYKAKPKLQPQFLICDRDQIPFAVIIGKDELDRGEIKIKDMRSKEQGEGGGILCKRENMIKELKTRLDSFPESLCLLGISELQICATSNLEPTFKNIFQETAGKNLTRHKANPYPKPKTLKAGNSNGVWRHDLYKTVNPGSSAKRTNPILTSPNGGLSIQQRLGTNSGIVSRMSIKGVGGLKQEFSFKGEGGPATIQITNVAPGTTANDIKTAFMDFGDILTLDMKPNKNNRVPISAELTYESKASAHAAIKKYNTALVDGRVLKVQFKQVGTAVAPANAAGTAAYRFNNKFTKSHPVTIAAPRNGRMYSDELMTDVVNTGPNLRRVSGGKGKQPSFSVTL
ncbi:hypothetical protein G9A89_003924 [Geosiphon pyriformis]|nr:hypothetical protein G9A89_003924 [Geosiphon pyriformis]